MDTFYLYKFNFELEYIILLLPFLTYTLISFFQKYIGALGTKILVMVSQLITLTLALIMLLLQIEDPSIIIYNFGALINIDFFRVDLGFTFDSVTIIAITVIQIISTLVIFYSFEYMKDDERFDQFIANLSFFLGTMQVLVTASNFIVLFIGWEGVGLASYLLINHWYNRISANKSALKAMVMNKFGDCFLILAFVLAFTIFGTFDFFTIFTLTPGVVDLYFNFLFIEAHALTLIGLFLFLAAVGKSAQLGLHTWLPDAMEGPTPVSSLLHAATMVTAGVLLLIRTSPILEFTENWLHVLMLVVGSLTAFFGASTALFQYDIKRIIAFSTCSQLGLMIAAIGVSNYQVAMFHFSNHAFFKALLFLSAGVLIHGLHHEQDIRRMGALRNFFPLVYTSFLLGSLSLIGFPFTSGFYSKDAIFESLFVSNLPYSWLGYFYSVLASCCTAAYSVRLLYLVFFSSPRAPKRVLKHVTETSTSIYFLTPLIYLNLFSIFIGYFTKAFFCRFKVLLFLVASILNLLYL